MKLIQTPISPDIYEALISEGSEWIKCYKAGGELFVLYSLDKTPKGTLKHISASHMYRDPLWQELIEIKNQLLGNIDAMMVMPKKADYINIHVHCFHIWETPTEWGIQ